MEKLKNKFQWAIYAWLAISTFLVWGIGDRWLYLSDGWPGTKDYFTPLGKLIVHAVLFVPVTIIIIILKKAYIRSIERITNKK